jgi:hypothetical protein
MSQEPDPDCPPSASAVTSRQASVSVDRAKLAASTHNKTMLVFIHQMSDGNKALIMTDFDSSRGKELMQTLPDHRPNIKLVAYGFIDRMPPHGQLLAMCHAPFDELQDMTGECKKHLEDCE